MGSEEKLVCLLGDILIYDHLGTNSEEIINLLNKADVVFGNLETTLATRGNPAAKVFTLKAKPSIVKDFKKMNMKALALANNHAMDFGIDGLCETKELLRRHNIACAGAGRNLMEALRPAILKLGEQRIAFLACSSHLTSDSVATEHRPGMAPLRVENHIDISARFQQEFIGRYPEITTKADVDDLNKLLIAVEGAKKEADFVVVSVHWGLDFQPMVLGYQIEVAHALIDHGADIIMGHGPHVLQGIEVYKKRYIFYSLGHFVFHVNQPGMTPVLAKLPDTERTKLAVIDPVTWRSDEAAIAMGFFSGSEIKRVEVMPVKLDSKGNPQGCDNESAMSILNYLAVTCRYLKTSVKIKGNKGILGV